MFNDFNFGNAIEARKTACLHVSRSSKRQNKRSLCFDNTIVVSPMYPVISKLRGDWPSVYKIDTKILSMILAGKFPTYSDALKLCNDYLMVALSSDFAVALSTLNTEKFLFASQFGFIGEADANNIYVRHLGSLQEVNDFVNRSNLDIRVIDAARTI